jgi:hypothetical protein
LKQKKSRSKQKTNEKAPTGPTAGAWPQPCKVEPDNNKHQSMNQQTNEQAAMSEPAKNICIFSDD